MKRLSFVLNLSEKREEKHLLFSFVFETKAFIAVAFLYKVILVWQLQRQLVFFGVIEPLTNKLI